MSESAVAPEVAVVDTEVKSDDIYIGQHRAQGPSDPGPFGHARAIKAGSNAQRSDRVREAGCQVVDLLRNVIDREQF